MEDQKNTKNQTAESSQASYEAQLNDQEKNRRAKLDLYKQKGIDPFGHQFETNATAESLHKDYASLQNEEVKEDSKVSYAGRIMLLRKMGKASFFTLQDKTGKVQVYIRKEEVGDENYELFKMADIGDICGVEGCMMKTKTGEVTIRCKKYTHLVKALHPLPDKFHGLSDPEERRRERYIDLIVNEDSKRIAFLRPKIVRGIQNFMDKDGFVEVETPILSPILGGANARPFVTHHNALDQDFYLRIATELSLKRLLVGGMERVYEIGRIFRNEGIDTTHNPEFTTMEAYQAYGNLDSMMKLTEDLFHYLAKEIVGKEQFHWLGYDIDISKPFKVITMTDAIKEKTGVDFYKVKDLAEAKELAKKFDVEVEPHFLWGHVLNAFFEKFCEADMVQPTFVCQHPVDISPLAKKDPNDPRFTQRFEMYISTHEMCNAFTELNDPIDQRARFEEQIEEKKNGNAEACEVDYDFLNALEYGMPPAGGIGFGIDRLCMFFCEADSIRDVLLFPTMKRNGNQK
ncbi:MAG: lysine--tRNA ligase [Bacilli bacterium]|jgi:lysyl-tRNA synthetase class 2|nr:lysine--tRNA ligase [Bacilli bacterium]